MTARTMPGPEYLRAAVRDGRIWKCARCDGTPKTFAAVCWYTPHDQTRPKVGYAVCPDCLPIIEGRFGPEAERTALLRIEKRLETEWAAGMAS